MPRDTNKLGLLCFKRSFRVLTQDDAMTHPSLESSPERQFLYLLENETMILGVSFNSPLQIESAMQQSPSTNHDFKAILSFLHSLHTCGHVHYDGNTRKSIDFEELPAAKMSLQINSRQLSKTESDTRNSVGLSHGARELR